MKFLQPLLICMVLCSCNDLQKPVPENVRNAYKYISLAECKYEPAAIASGTALEILANSGGPKNSGDTVFYYQFLAVDKSSGDTLIILCPEITVDTEVGIAEKTSTTPLLFDISAGVTTAFYEKADSSKSLLLNGDNMERLVKGGDTTSIEHLLNPDNVIGIVVLNKNENAQSFFKFKTAVGNLNFKKIPWKT